jgi:hypothetical protein
MTDEEWEAGKERCIGCDDNGTVCEECGQPDWCCQCETETRLVACDVCDGATSNSSIAKDSEAG